MERPAGAPQRDFHGVLRGESAGVDVRVRHDAPLRGVQNQDACRRAARRLSKRAPPVYRNGALPAVNHARHAVRDRGAQPSVACDHANGALARNVLKARGVPGAEELLRRARSSARHAAAGRVILGGKRRVQKIPFRSPDCRATSSPTNTVGFFASTSHSAASWPPFYPAAEDARHPPDPAPVTGTLMPVPAVADY